MFVGVAYTDTVDLILDTEIEVVVADIVVVVAVVDIAAVDLTFSVENSKHIDSYPLVVGSSLVKTLHSIEISK